MLNNSLSPHEISPSKGPSVPARLLYVESLADTSTHGDSHGLLELWELILVRKLTLLGVLLLGLFVAALFTFMQRPLFEATTTIEMQPPGEAMGVTATVTDMQTETFMRTQLRILESRTLRTRVENILSSENRQWSISPSRLEVWARWAHLPFRVAEASAGLPPVTLSVRSFDGTRLVEIQTTSTDPQYALRYTDTLVHEFSAMQRESSLQSAQRTSQWISQQIDDVRQNLSKAESVFQTFSRNAGRVNGPDQLSIDQTRLAQLETELSRAIADRYQKQSNFEIAKQNSAETVPQVADDGKLSSYALKLSELKREMAELRSQLTPEHYKVQQKEAQITELESIIRKERTDVIARVQNDYNAAVRREQLLRDAYAEQKTIVYDQDNQSVSFDLLKQEVDSDRKLYDVLLEKAKASSLAVAMTGGNVRVVDAAVMPSLPFSPTPIRNFSISILLSLVAGVFLIILSDHVNRSLKAPGETPHYLKVPELGVIPAAEPDALSSSRGKLDTLSLGASQLNGEGSRALASVWKSGSSLIAESFHSTVTSILASPPNGVRPQVILVTSPGRGDGKSATVASLGTALAEIDQRVLLIDGDMRKPQLHHLFGVPNSWGLSDLLREKTPIEEMPNQAITRRTEVPDLCLLPSGPGTATIANLLNSKRLDALLERVRRDFDIILIDTPPMSYMSDARVLGRVADAVILVIRAGQTTRDEALAAKDRLEADGTRLLGTILNGWDAKPRARYNYYRYSENRVGG